MIGKTREKPPFGITSRGEKVCYGFGELGSRIALAFPGMFVTLYYTDSAGIAAAYVGSMMLIARILDSFSDIAMGVVIEKTRTPWGKARPWLLFGGVPLTISLILLFNVPGHWNGGAKNIYVFATYVFMSVICYTMTALPLSAMLSRVSLDENDRNVINVVRTLMGGGIVLLVANIPAPALKALGGEGNQRAWTILSLFFAVGSLLFFMLCFWGTREKLPLAVNKDGSRGQPLGPALKSLLGNRYFYITTFIYLLSAITSGTGGILVYFCRDVLGNTNLIGPITLAGAAGIAATPLLPPLFKRFGRMRVTRWGILLTAAANLLLLFTFRHLPFLFILSFLGTLGAAPAWVSVAAMTCDVIDYGEWKSGIRYEGLATSANSFGSKLGTGLGSGLLGWALAWSHYQPGAAAQSSAAQGAMTFLIFGVPLILNVLCFVLLLFWDIDKYQGQIQAFIVGRASGVTGGEDGGKTEGSAEGKDHAV
jgi:GPH family glycoside/pentoside/hexuronide:cation symporter